MALTALLDCAGVPATHHGEALVALDKLDKIGVDGVRAEFAARGISPDAASASLAFLASTGPAAFLSWPW